TVELQPRVDRALQADLYEGAITDHDGSNRQRVRADRHQRKPGNAGLHDRPVRRNRVRGRAGRRRYDQPVSAQVIDELTVDIHHELDQATDRALVDGRVVERGRRERDDAAPKHLGREHRALFYYMLAGEYVPHRVDHLGQGDVRREPEPALVDADQG